MVESEFTHEELAFTVFPGPSYRSLNMQYALTFITQRAENPVKPPPSLPLKPSLVNVIKDEMQLFRQYKQVRL